MRPVLRLPKECFVFLLWIALTHSGGSADADSGAALGGLPAYGAAVWLLF